MFRDLGRFRALDLGVRIWPRKKARISRLGEGAGMGCSMLRLGYYKLYNDDKATMLGVHDVAFYITYSFRCSSCLG